MKNYCTLKPKSAVRWQKGANDIPREGGHIWRPTARVILIDWKRAVFERELITTIIHSLVIGSMQLVRS